MFGSVESLGTKRATSSLVASSIMWIRYNFSPRPSSQSCSLVSHLHQLAARTATRPPRMDRLDLLLPAAP